MSNPNPNPMPRQCTCCSDLRHTPKHTIKIKKFKAKEKTPKEQEPQPSTPNPKSKVQTERLVIKAPHGQQMNTKSFITITFGEVAETHVGMSKEGSILPPTKGLSLELLQSIANEYTALGYEVLLYNLTDLLTEDQKKLGGTEYVMAPKEETRYVVDQPHVLIIRNGVNAISGNPDAHSSIYRELTSLTWDTKARQKGRVVTKRKRHNLNFADYARESDVEQGVGTVINFKEVPALSTLRQGIMDMLDRHSDVEFPRLMGEGNNYYDYKTCCINYHGDAERRVVIAARFGATMAIRYQWFYQRKPVGKNFIAELNHGDIYFMSEKAVGTDWGRSKYLTLRHAAGCDSALA